MNLGGLEESALNSTTFETLGSAGLSSLVSNTTTRIRKTRTSHGLLIIRKLEGDTFP